MADVDQAAEDHGVCPGFFLVAGNPRSGSHALGLHLERRYALAMPTEPRFASLFARHAALAGELSRPANQRRMLRCIFAFLWLWERRNRTPQQLHAAIPYSLLNVADQADSIVSGCMSYGDLVDALHAHYARRCGAQLSLDKVTFLHDDPVEALVGQLPGMKVVHIVRDGRDVYLSWRRVWFGIADVDEAALRWRRRVLRLRRLGVALEANYLELRYEDFVAEPETACERIRAFVGLRRRAAGVDTARPAPQAHSAKFAVMAAREGHDRLAQSLDASSAARWHSELSDRERRRFDAIAGDALEAMGYPVAPGTAKRRFGLRWWARLRLGWRCCLRPRVWKQYAVAWLPPLLLISDRLGLPLSARLAHRAAAASASTAAATETPQPQRSS